MNNDGGKSTGMKKRRKFIVLVICYFIPLAMVLYHCLVNGFSADQILEYRQQFRVLADSNWLLFILLFVTTYFAIVVSSMSFTVVMNLFAGYLFGSVWGALLAAAAATGGSYVLYKLSRTVTNEIRGKNFQLKALEGGPEKTGLMLFFLRLSPFFPAPVITMGCGAFGVKARLFVLTTFFGSLPLILIYTLIGNRLELINKINDIYDHKLMIMLTLLALLSLTPLLSPKIRKMLRPKLKRERA